MTYVQGLKKGEFIVITGLVDEEVPSFDDYPYTPQKKVPHGRPLRVLSVAFPFIAVTDGEKTFAIDSQTFRVQRVHREYVKAMLDALPRKKGIQVSKAESAHPLLGRRRKAKPDPRACPKCGERMVERLTSKKHVWHRVCPDCGWDSGPTDPPVFGFDT